MSGKLFDDTSIAQAASYTFLPTAGASSVSGADFYGLTLAYTVGRTNVWVWVNGDKVPPPDIVATNGSTISFPGYTFATGDVVEVVTFSSANIADALRLSQNGADILNKPVFLSNIGGEPATTAKSLSASGYVKLGNGLILQWGSASGADATVTFTVPFPTACLNISITRSGADVTGYIFSGSARNVTTTNFVANNRYYAIGNSPMAIAAGDVYFWQAIGY